MLVFTHLTIEAIEFVFMKRKQAYFLHISLNTYGDMLLFCLVMMKMFRGDVPMPGGKQKFKLCLQD
jgi:hypothetical protein